MDKIIYIIWSQLRVSARLSTRADFNSKIFISLNEMRESSYLLRILNSLELGDKSLSEELVRESSELKKILGSVSSNVSESLKKN
ncbi:MAG TPA: four helix bundle protein [Ignavibacteria bacterium]|nr:four helix bundle protein [Ignavibacteria bacterium]